MSIKTRKTSFTLPYLTAASRRTDKPMVIKKLTLKPSVGASNINIH